MGIFLLNQESFSIYLYLGGFDLLFYEVNNEKFRNT